MKNQYKLVEYGKDLPRGYILRCKTGPSGSDFIDLMITESYSDNQGYALYVINGYKAGLRYVIFPHESVPVNNSGFAVSIGADR